MLFVCAAILFGLPRCSRCHRRHPFNTREDRLVYTLCSKGGRSRRAGFEWLSTAFYTHAILDVARGQYESHQISGR
jgi:hypothetical protein